MGISGGLIAASALAISHDFESLYDACIVAMGSVCRLCRFAVSAHESETLPAQGGPRLLRLRFR